MLRTVIDAKGVGSELAIRTSSGGQLAVSAVQLVIGDDTGTQTSREVGMSVNGASVAMTPVSAIALAESLLLAAETASGQTVAELTKETEDGNN